jgi:hypothetical protein
VTGGTRLAPDIRLDDEGWPRFPIVPRRRHRHNVAALQVQPATDPAATLSKRRTNLGAAVTDYAAVTEAPRME